MTVVEQEGDLLEPEPEPPVDDDVLQSREVGRRVEAVAARGACARRQQADLVVVVQGAHCHAERIGHLADGQRRLHLGCIGHVPTVAPHVT